MQTLLDNFKTILATLVLCVMGAIITGVLPLASGVPMQQTLTLLFGAFLSLLASDHIDSLTLFKTLVHEMAKVDFADNRYNEVLDKLDELLGTDPTVKMGSSITTVSGVSAAELPTDANGTLTIPRG